MINANMRTYNYYTLGELDSYGQQKISAEVQGVVKMSIATTSQNVQDNVLYTNASYIGLTHDAAVNDSYVIQYGDIKLKVLYVGQQGRFRAVYMAKVG